ncbi:Gluconate transport-inducing protein [Coemansia sp. RSA 2320]|nr:Gluconate transport-inducing protein [Coemansia sp. RSA 2320]
MGDTRMETYYGFVTTSEDALALFEACRLGYKQRVPRRLSDGERSAIRSGSVFVWEEGESGMKRWTDGRSWSPSRVQGCFLTYHEWEGRRRAQRHPSAYHMQNGAYGLALGVHGLQQGHHHHPQAVPMGIARYGHFIGGPTKAGATQVQYGMPKENGMLKKALSIRTTNGKKLHIIAYYSKEDHVKRRLLTPTTDPNFPRLDVPPNLYPDMSPETMYGAGHATGCYQSMDNDSDYATPDGTDGPPAAPLPALAPRRSHNLSIRYHTPSLPSSSSPSSSSAVDDISAAFNKARVQSLVLGSDVPPLSALSATSCPAPELRADTQRQLPMSAPSASCGVSRPSSNSFSSYCGPVSAVTPSSSSSSSSAPTSSVMRSAGTLAAVHGSDENPSAGVVPSGGYRSRYTGLGLGTGGVGGGGHAAGHRATPLRSATTAAVMMHRGAASATAKEEGGQLPLLLSPINVANLAGNLADIRRDTKEGPRRLPSISAGLGIFTTAAAPLPSPLQTPRQALARGFDGDSLSLLALAADRAQGRNGSGHAPQGRIASMATHHPYSRPWRRGPSMRSVSLRQSEDVRQLGALDQGLRLK